MDLAQRQEPKDGNTNPSNDQNQAYSQIRRTGSINDCADTNCHSYQASPSIPLTILPPDRIPELPRYKSCADTKELAQVDTYDQDDTSTDFHALPLCLRSSATTGHATPRSISVSLPPCKEKQCFSTSIACMKRTSEAKCAFVDRLIANSKGVSPHLKSSPRRHNPVRGVV